MDHDIILCGGQVVDVVSLRLRRLNVFIRDGIIVNLSEDAPSESAAKVIDVSGHFICPGFIDSHLHIESIMLSPLNFALAAVVHGTTSIFIDPHEIANVAGKEGIDLFLNQSNRAPMDIIVGIPSCVPATHLDDSGASITLDDIKQMIPDKLIYGLAEMMNFPGIINGQGDYRQKCDFVFDFGKIVDGHCPGLSGDDLDVYITNGRRDGILRITSDHEVSSFGEAAEKIEKGMYVAMRYGSAEKDMDRILPGLIEKGMDLSRIMLCSDDLNPLELDENGHVDRIIKRAKNIIQQHSNVDRVSAAIRAISLATIHPARYFQKYFRYHDLPEIGEIAVGKRANIVVLSSLEDIQVEHVFYQGEQIVKSSKYIGKKQEYDYSAVSGRVHVGKKLVPDDFCIPPVPGQTRARVIEKISGSLHTKSKIFPVHPIDGRDCCMDNAAKISVFERHHATGRRALGFVTGLNIKKGAVASTVSHDSHNLVVVGQDNRDMAKAANYIVEIGGGLAVSVDGDITCLPLEIAGLMSCLKIDLCVKGYKKLMRAVKKTGAESDNLFMEIAFLCLPVIPELRITDRGLVDVNAFQIVELFP